ncbi:hypothetical protein CPC08DRAFT_712071 [Agrocybe pediades]|nr:hypothetical protein CPC08DRAFT_712071 [Agrocybe pediades]
MASIMTVASLLSKAEDFFVTGFISLAIVLATIRAYFAKITADLEWPSFTVVFFFCLVVTLGLYAYRWRRIQRRRSRSRRDEERGMAEGRLNASFHILPIVLDTPRRRSVEESFKLAATHATCTLVPTSQEVEERMTALLRESGFL